jgi:uncharacterized protein YggL (DUF469 family)
MFRYFSQLRLRRDTPIWPIVLYMPRVGEGLGFETYTETLFGEEFLPFRYWCISLVQLSAEEYLATGNPVAYGLAPLMNHGKLSKPRLKAMCLSGIAQSEITEVQAAILACFVDTYLPLTQAEEVEFQQLIQREEVTVMEFVTSWERRGLREALLSLLDEKFGSLPETVTQQVQSIDSEKELDRLLRQLIHANSLAEMGLDGAKEEVTVMEFVTSWERRARVEKTRENLLALLGEKFGSLPETSIQRVQSIDSEKELDRLLRQLIHANSLAEMRLDGTKK